VLNYKKRLKIKEKEAELKEAGRQKDFEKAKILWQEIQQIRKTM
jgi:DNA primase